MKIFIGIMSFLALISGAVVARFWLITLGVLFILKITSLIAIPWFAVATWSVIGTPLAMLIGGLFLILLNYFILFLLAESM